MSEIYLCFCGEKMKSKSKYCPECRKKEIREQVIKERKKNGYKLDMAFEQ